MLALYSCSMDVEKAKLDPADKYVSAVVESHADVVLDASNIDATTAFKWSASSFGAPTQVEYSLYLKCGSVTTLAAKVYTLGCEVKNKDLNKILTDQFGLSSGERGSVSAYVESVVYSLYGSLSGDPIRSNTINFNITAK